MKFFAQFFPGAHAGVFDPNIVAQPQPFQPNQALGQLLDPDLVTHVQHEQSAGGPERGGQEHQAGRLGDRHEEALRVGVGDRDRSASFDLTQQRRYHAATTTEHVAKAHRRQDRCRRCRLADSDNHQLGHAFGQAHEAGRVDRFVGRDDHDPLGAKGDCRFADRECSEDVGHESLVGIGFDQRHVLVGRGVEDHLGLLAGEELAHAPRIGHVGDTRGHGHAAADCCQVAFELVQAGLVHVDSHHRCRSHGQDLSGQLRADRAGSAGDQHAFAADCSGARLDVQSHDRARQELFNLDRARRGQA